MAAVLGVELVETSDVPAGTHPKPGAKRRWQELSETILAAPEGKSVRVKVQAGVDAETLRSGVQAEFKRLGRRVSITSATEDDGSTSVYLTARTEPHGDGGDGHN